MFTIAPHDEGFVVTWPDESADDAKVVRKELLLQGLPRGGEWTTGIVVRRYRNQFETLHMLLEIFLQKRIEVTLAPELASIRDAGQVEQDQISKIRSRRRRLVAESPTVKEFKAGRKLLAYQCGALAKHLLDGNAADFSVPGSGKTTVALAYWSTLKRETPNLGLWVIGPLSCFRPWEEEFEACIGRAPQVLRIRGTAQQRRQQMRSARRSELLLCTYHTAWREETALIELLKSRPWLLVLDEAHYIKSMNGTLASSVRHLAPYATKRMVLTGTPMPRSPDDIWSIFTFLWPTETLLGNANQHAVRCKQTPPAAICEELRQELAPFFHRTCKHELGLPPIDDRYPVIPVEEMPATQRLIIRLIEQRTLEEQDHLSDADQGHLRRWRRARIIRLLQAASNPLLLAEALQQSQLQSLGEDEPEFNADDPDVLPLTDADSDLASMLRRYQDNKAMPAKVRYVVDRCRELVKKGKKVVIWTVFLGNVELLSRLLQDLSPLCITGMVPAYEAEDDETGERTREKRIALFKGDPDRKVLIANAAACAESISLHKVCQHAIYLERSFNAALFIQSLDRIHRQGMPRKTTAHVEIPHIPCAVERVLNRKLRSRQQQLFRLLDDPMPVVGFDDDMHQGLFELADLESVDELFAEVLAEIRSEGE